MLFVPLHQRNSQHHPRHHPHRRRNQRLHNARLTNNHNITTASFLEELATSSQPSSQSSRVRHRPNRCLPHGISTLAASHFVGVGSIYDPNGNGRPPLALHPSSRRTRSTRRQGWQPRRPWPVREWDLASTRTLMNTRGFFACTVLSTFDSQPFRVACFVSS